MRIPTGSAELVTRSLRLRWEHREVSAVPTVRLRTGCRRTPVDGRHPALYVMVAADGLTAKVGALEAAANAPQRLRRVDAAHRIRHDSPSSFPIRLAVVVELEDLAITGDRDEDSEERWAEVEHLESALRLALARRVGRLARWSDWIHVDVAMDDSEWKRQVEDAWSDVKEFAYGPDEASPGGATLADG